jgi:putative membrane-bound dehydrogenase-like protein
MKPLVAGLWVCLLFHPFALWGEDAAPAPLSPQDSMKLMEISPGYMVELIAAEPDVVDPVAFTWDANGQLFVAEMSDYPVNPGGGRIKMLIDRDHDGRVEGHILFAEGIPFPNGLLAYRGGLLVTAAPDILYLQDTDGDGKADKREVILTGFVAGNQQLRVNGLAYGLDGWVYAANGRNGGMITSPRCPDQPPVNIDRHDLRFKPDTGEVEAVAGFSQFGNAFDSFGERFINWNTIPIRHVVFPLDVTTRHPTFPPSHESELLDDPVQQNRVFPKSARPATFNREPAGYFNASCGLSIETGGIFPADDAGSAIVCEPLFNIVHRRHLLRDGATFIARRPREENEREFLACRDSWFRPVFTQSGPDGGMYIADFYRQWVEHPDFVRPELRGSVAWDVGKDRGRIYRVRPSEASLRPIISLSSESSVNLLSSLGDANSWRRDTARRLILERNDRSVRPALSELLQHHTDPRARLQALSILNQWDQPTETLLLAKDDPHPAVRQWLIRFIRQRPDAAQRILSLLPTKREDSPMSAAIDFELALAAERLATPEKCSVLERLDTQDPWVRTAIFTVADDAAASLLERYLARTKQLPDSRFIETLARIAGRRESNPEGSRLAGIRFSPESRAGGSVAAGWLTGLAESGKRIPSKIGERSLSEWIAWARRTLENESAEPNQMTDALAVLAVDSSVETTTFLTELMKRSLPLEVTQACLRSVRSRAGQEVATGLLAAWPAASPSLKRDLMELLLARPERIAPLVQAIEEGTVRASEMEPDAKTRLVERVSSDQKERVTKLLGGSANSDRLTVIESVKVTLPAAGDMAKGKDVFVKHCAGCHRSGDLGHRVGPDLAGMSSKSREQLLEDILDPNRQTLPDFVAVSVVTSDGVTLTGLLGGETSTTITLRRAEGVVEQVARSQVEEFRGTGKSLMPEGFEQSLSPSQLADLMAFLRQRP